MDRDINDLYKTTKDRSHFFSHQTMNPNSFQCSPSESATTADGRVTVIQIHESRPLVSVNVLEGKDRIGDISDFPSVINSTSMRTESFTTIR